MAIKIKRQYRFAMFSSLYISLVLSGLFLAISFYYELPLIWSAVFLLVSFITCFSIVQYYAELFVYRKVQDIYKTVFLDLPVLETESISLNMESLSKEIASFSENKRLQIQDLKSQENFRKEFIGNLAHELKTPLFTAQSYLLTLQDGAVENMEVRDKYLERSAQSIERLVLLVEDLDKITQLETGNEPVDKQPVDVVSLTKAVFEMLEVMASEKEIKLSFDEKYSEPIWVLADEKKIHNVLVNLILNSIKYGKQKGTTEVAFDKTSPQQIIVRINDNGQGIASEYLPRLFERFYRVDKSGSRKQGGSGLGLAIVKHIIEAHQQTIKVESQEGLGTEFSFSLEALSR